MTFCLSCYDEFEPDHLNYCLSDHCLCNSCFKTALKSGDVKSTELQCLVPECTSNIILTPESLQNFKIYNQDIIRILKENIAFEKERASKIITDLCATTFQQFEDIDHDKFIKDISDDLSLKCPRCSMVFNDFDGCLALTCGNPQCNAGFCALCLADCGTDAHTHLTDVEKTPFYNKPLFDKKVHERKELIAKKAIDPYIRKLEERTVLAAKLADVDSNWLLIETKPGNVQFRREIRDLQSDLESKKQDHRDTSKIIEHLLTKQSQMERDFNIQLTALKQDHNNDGMKIKQCHYKINSLNQEHVDEIKSIKHEHADEIKSLCSVNDEKIEEINSLRRDKVVMNEEIIFLREKLKVFTDPIKGNVPDSPIASKVVVCPTELIRSIKE